MAFFEDRDRRIGAVLFLSALLCIFAWIPLDSATGIAERVRGRNLIGDAMAPTVAASILLISSALLMVKGGEVARTDHPSLLFLLVIGLIVGASFTLMRWAGPAAVWIILGDEPGGYRPLRDTIPWKYLGYLCGGTLLIFALVALIERRMSWRSLLIALAMTLALALLYGMLFDNLLLPPNGDV